MRVSNELGAGNPLAACLAVCVAVVMVAIESILAITILISVRRVWGYCFSNEKRVVKYIADMMLLLAATHLTDGIQSVLNGMHSNIICDKLLRFFTNQAFLLL